MTPFGTGERVRLIGVGTPETKHPNKPVEQFGKEASAFTRRMVEGKRVRLEYDPSNAARGHKDRYGRTLAFIFLEDGNATKYRDHKIATLPAERYCEYNQAKLSIRLPFSRMEKLKLLEREALEAKMKLQ